MRAEWTNTLGVVLAVAVGAVTLIGCGSNGSPPVPGDEAGATQEAGLDGTTATSDGAQPGDDGAAPGDDGAAPPVDAGPPCDPDVQADIDCTGHCGPMKDACGHTKMCGGCQVSGTDAGADGGAQVLVCDLTTNTCVTPKVTCTALAAQCGTVRDTCGDYLDCPDSPTKGCAAGQECNNDTHQCQACEQVTCADLGYECGFAWLGCGPDTESNFTDCGKCANDGDGGARVCNPTFNVCEPKCVPQSAAVICAAAKAKNGVECGFISDGCGGIVECDANVKGFGCPSGQSCGVRGIANHCDPFETPDECLGQGRECGNIKSSCTGQTVHCGDCPMGQVCNSNGQCGAPCTPKTCADYSQFQCGTFDDGCGATVTCGTCAGGVCDQTTNTCCQAKQCSDYSGECGTNLPNGCGGNSVSCTCAAGSSCTADGGAAPAPASGKPGECCTPKTYGSGQCGTNLPDGCGNKANVNCPANQDCVANSTGAAGPAPASGVVGSCCMRSDLCSTVSAGTCAVLQDSCRTATSTHTCNECASGLSCVNAACCQGAAACTGNGGEGAECNDTHQPVDTGCGSARTCTCSNGRTCWCGDHVCGSSDGAGTCKTTFTCAANYKNQCGTGLDNGTGGTLDCGCSTGQVCTSTTPGTAGTCQCNTPTGKAYTCATVPGGPGQAGGDACGSFADGCGNTLTCNCSNGMACNTGASPNVCCQPAACPAPSLGSACGSVTNGCTTVSCGCPSGTDNQNFTCSGGHCACVKNTCHGLTGAQPDGCGGTLQCGG